MTITTKCKMKDFCIFILTHGRPDRVYTVKSLLAAGYTGDFYIVVDDEDATEGEYRKRYGNKVIVFDKKKVANETDEGDNFDDRRAIIYARNACFEIAKGLGVTYFMQLDDDYTAFVYKFDADKEFKESRIKSLDANLKALLKFYTGTTALSVAIAQNGDFIGGRKSGSAKFKLKRKAMNTFICSTERPFKFFGRINEDVNTYTNLASRGGLFLTVPNVAIIQKQTQSNAGGMTELYLDSGTYVKSFYSVMYSPSSVDIMMMGEKHRRLHHRVKWKCAVPKIIDEGYKLWQDRER